MSSRNWAISFSFLAIFLFAWLAFWNSRRDRESPVSVSIACPGCGHKFKVLLRDARASEYHASCPQCASKIDMTPP